VGRAPSACEGDTGMTPREPALVINSWSRHPLTGQRCGSGGKRVANLLISGEYSNTLKRVVRGPRGSVEN